jgi:signal transduction histidine kinase/HPt (histidine-containing phosphotransfer) domain-containing protein/HAMP domain-containing protein/ActR/RegA family two-component response regulator
LDWHKNLKIRSKLFIASGTLILLIAISNIFTITQFVRTSHSYNSLINDTIQREIYLLDAETDIMKLRYYNLSIMYLLSNSANSESISAEIFSAEEIFNQYNNRRILFDSFIKNMNRYNASVNADSALSAEEKQLRLDIWNQIIDSFSNTYVYLANEIDITIKNADTQRSEEIIQQILTMGNETIAKLDELNNIAINKVKNDSIIIAARNKNAINMVLGITGFFIAISIFLSLIISATIRNPVMSMQKAMAEISRGNLSYPIRSEYRDELGALSNSIGSMVDTIAEMNKTMAVLDYLDCMIYIIDTDYRIIYLNNKMAETFAVEKEGSSNKRCYEHLKKLNWPCADCVLSYVLAEENYTYTEDIEYLWDENINKWFSGKVAIIRWVDGSPVLFHCLTDVTMKREYEDTLLIAKHAAEAASASKSAFLSNMSHEIRTPMNAIIGMTDLLTHEQLSERQMGYINDINLSAHSLLSLINDILDLSKIESGKSTLNPVNYDFRVLISNITSTFSYVAQKKGLEFRFESSSDLPEYLYGDDLKLRQVLTNICGNAVKYTEKGHVRLKVSVSGGNLVFEISDTGMGIRKEDISKLFNSFERAETDKNRGIVGTGLGLSICKSFVEMMGGYILIDSEYEQGSVFTVIIPAVLGNKDEVKSAKNLKKEQTLFAPDADILVVDDNEFNLRVAEGLLGLFKVKTKTASSGRKAIDMVQKNLFDLVFMDHMMPEMDGVETTGIIRKLGGQYASLPVIALTANAIQGAKEMFLANGFNGFISKPIEMQELGEILSEWLPPEKIEKIEIASLNVESQGEGTKSDLIRALEKIDEINTGIGLNRVSGMEDMYSETLEVFTKDILPNCTAMSDSLAYGEIQSFSISVHAMKSALSTIGAMNLSETAAKLETAAKNKDIEYCIMRFPAFNEKLLSLHEQLSSIYPFPGKKIESKKKSGDAAFLHDNINKALLAAADFDGDSGFKAINDLLAYDFGEENNALLESATEAFRSFDYDTARDFLSKLLPPSQ